MDTGVGNWADKLGSWSEFILLHVLPTTISQIYDWVREWQILAATVVVLAFFNLWSHAILRAARRSAKETVQTETRAFGASLTLLRRQVEQSTLPSPRALIEAPRTVELRPVQAVPADCLPPDSPAAIEHLRQAIRLALSTIPLSDEPLLPAGVRLYRAAIEALADAGVTPGTGAGDGDLQQILSELTVLKQSFPPQSCREAWQSLVKVNALAREFHEVAQARAATP